MRNPGPSDSETGSRMVVARGWEREMGSCYLMGTEFRLYKMKRGQRVDGGNGCTKM